MPKRRIPGSARNGIVPQLPIERLRAKLVINEASGCHEWTGALDRKGYARIAIGGKRNAMAHRVAYEAAHGAIPDGLTIDHLCRNKACCNPDHLQVVTSSENTRRGNSGWRDRVKTHCPHGHPYDDSNTGLTPAGARYCRICKREQTNRNSRARRAAARLIYGDKTSVAYRARSDRAEFLLALLAAANERLTYLSDQGGVDNGLAPTVSDYRDLSSRLHAEHRAKRATESLASRSQRALEEIALLAEECVIFDQENFDAIPPDDASVTTVANLWRTRLALSRSWKNRVDEIRRQALGASHDQ